MSVFLLVGVALAGAAIVAAMRARPVVAAAVGVAALGLCVIAAIAMVPLQTLVVDTGAAGPTGLAITRYARLLVGFTAASGLLLALVGAAWGRSPAGPAAALVSVAAIALALVATDPIAGTWAVAAGGAGALAAGLVLRPTPAAAGRDVGDALRAMVVAAAVAIAGMSWAAAAMRGPDPDPTLGAVAFVAVATGLVVRWAAVPAHGWAARLADAIPLPSVAPALAWLPAAWTVVALAWTDAAISPFATELTVERGVLLAVSVATLALAPLAAWTADDLGHGMVYLVVAGAGVALLAPAALDPAAWAPGRSWLAVQLVASTGLIAVAVGLEGAYGTRHIPDLSGWARRSPALGLAAAGLALAIVGLPGLAVWEGRAALVDANAEGPLAVAMRALLVLPLVPLARLLLVGVGPASSAVAAGSSERPRLRRVAARPDDVVRLGRENAAPIAGLGVLLLAVLALALAVGGLGLPAAARGGPPALSMTPSGPTETPGP